MSLSPSSLLERPFLQRFSAGFFHAKMLLWFSNPTSINPTSVIPLRALRTHFTHTNPMTQRGPVTEQDPSPNPSPRPSITNPPNPSPRHSLTHLLATPTTGGRKKTHHGWQLHYHRILRNPFFFSTIAPEPFTLNSVGGNIKTITCPLPP